jgi:hypothetical protein
MLEKAVYDNYRWDHKYDDELLEIYNQVFEFLKSHRSDIRIFTTNYDRVIEQFCIQTRERHRLIDGFDRVSSDSEISEWSGNFADPKDKDSRTIVRLYKLHGSLNWKSHKRFDLIKTNEEGRSTDINYPRNLVIMPTLSPKDEEETKPFNELRNHFENFMEEADLCIVIGFSFRDNLNDIFKDFVRRGKTLFSISPTAISDFRINVLNEKPPYQVLQEWEKSDNQILNTHISGTRDDGSVVLIQKPLAVETIREILGFCKATIIDVHNSNI